MDNISALFQFCSLPRLNRVSVVFDFNASLNDVAPLSPISLAVDLMRMKELIVNGCLLCCFFVNSLYRSRTVSVVFDFNASLNDAAPVSPMLLPVDLMRMKKKLDC